VTLQVIGWREWVGLPALRIPWIKAKIDTGARTSSLHAFDVVLFERDDGPWVRFSIHPWQGSARDETTVVVPVADHRNIRSSNGSVESRPVIRTPLRVGLDQHDIELTLTRRDTMGFRMLLGREAIRGSFAVDAGRSYLIRKPPDSVVSINRAQP
jgi:hypothetical protein